MVIVVMCAGLILPTDRDPSAFKAVNRSASVPGTMARRTLMLLPVIRKTSSVAALSI